MNQKKAKAIRKAMRRELEQGSSYSWLAHPKLYRTVANTLLLRYTFQYIKEGGDRLVKLGKTIYNLSGVLPNKEKGND